MKKTFLLLLILINTFLSNAQYSPESKLNFVHLMRIPPTGNLNDSILAYRGSDGFVYKVPASVLNSKNIPLKGTDAGKPVTGDIELGEGDKKIYHKTNLDDTGFDIESAVSFSETGPVNIYSQNNTTGYTGSILLGDDVMQVGFDNPASLGIVGTRVFSNDGSNPAQYVQNQHLTDAVNIPVSASQKGIVNNISLQELGGVDKKINGIRIGQGNKLNSESTVLGTNALGVDTGGYNTAIGFETLMANTTGYSNTAVGNFSMRANTTGNDNTAIGANAMALVTAGSGSVSIGSNSMATATASDKNTAIGVGSLYKNTSGYSNVSFGYFSMENTTTGGRNTAIGQYSLRNNTTGIANTVLGVDAGNSITTESFNTIIGANQSTGITGSNNVVLADGNGSIAIRKLPDNTLLAPTQTNALITADATGKAIITKEFYLSDAMRLTTNQLVSGIKDFSSSPIVPNGVNSNHAVNKSQLDLKADDNAVVKIAGTQTVTGLKNFTGGFGAESIVSTNGSAVGTIYLGLGSLPGYNRRNNPDNITAWQTINMSSASTGNIHDFSSNVGGTTSVRASIPKNGIATSAEHLTRKDYVDGLTGWASYTDTAYTSGAPFTINSGVTSTLPNNAGTVINNQLPAGVTSFYNSGTGKFTPITDGDYYIVTIRFKAQTTAPTAGYFDFGIDIGGALGVQFKETKIFAKGAGIEHNFSVTVPCYTGSTFVANGGLIKLTSGNGNMTVYDINFQFDRVHKSK